MAGLDGVTPVVPALLTPEAAKRLLEQRRSVEMREELWRLSRVDSTRPYAVRIIVITVPYRPLPPPSRRLLGLPLVVVLRQQQQQLGLMQLNIMAWQEEGGAVYSRHEAWLMKREEKLEERRREKEEASMKECVFKPKTTTTGRRGSKMGPQHVKAWEERRKAREIAGEAMKEEKEIAACAFKPYTNPVRRSMRHAREYMQTNVFDRLASHGRVLADGEKSDGMPTGRVGMSKRSEEEMQHIM
ncbi:hypothetical protein Pmar_PMAR008188 [Perkinsus marinus ATCC 50983]|uniref:Uncharacterized protein n=1 Tax=Perkinsus marinus (strain ATCC 50983 / TXsc) TaxID=423536 RepID=C5LNH1_PERM5|nr:hypothetical protein Pmar_PMAR008188 [Perkinsus marinus ATCC 50983]EER01722.1 hypothetical protein Pmar_PMAR008188 [Perkinsus marinus ATCC 50983]|eukprot:XP_002769004.1 hypothetical protein Pmar_PMAR008188 [Perkinsus marinus ATCC 50983]